MRVAVISDIHGNCFGFDAALRSIREGPVDKIVCLGDTVQGGAQPVETVEKLRALGCPVVLGNADAWLFHDVHDTPEPFSEEQREVRAWTISELGREGMEFIRSYKPTIDIDLDGAQRMLCFHGSPGSYDDILLPESSDEDWVRLLGSVSQSYMAGGHTHTQQVRRVGQGLFFNPGSIGVVYNYHVPKERYCNDAWAEYAILNCHDGSVSLEFRRVPYNVERLVEAVEASGRPYKEKMVANYRASGRS